MDKKNIIEIGKHHAKIERRIIKMIESDNTVAIAPGHKHGLFLHIFAEKSHTFLKLANKISELLKKQGLESNTVIDFQLGEIQKEFEGHFVTNSIFSKTNVRYKIQRYYRAIHDYLNFIEIVDIALKRTIVSFDDDEWIIAKEHASSTLCMFRRKERQSQELHQSVSFHINITGIVYTIVGIAFGIMATGLAMDGGFLNTFIFVNALKSGLFYFGAIIGIVVIPVIWFRIGMKKDLVTLLERLRSSEKVNEEPTIP